MGSKDIKSSDQQNPPPYTLVGPGNHHGVLLSTVNDFPGYEITKIYGLVYGTFVTNQSKGTWNRLKCEDGEYVKYRDQVILAREKAASRLIDGVIDAGGNAAYGMRFDVEYINQMIVEVTCYATAVTIIPLPKRA